MDERTFFPISRLRSAAHNILRPCSRGRLNPNEPPDMMETTRTEVNDESVETVARIKALEKW